MKILPVHRNMPGQDRVPPEGAYGLAKTWAGVAGQGHGVAEAAEPKTGGLVRE